MDEILRVTMNTYTSARKLGRQLKFRVCYYDVSSQLYAVERQKYEIGYPIFEPDKSGQCLFLVSLSFKK